MSDLKFKTMLYNDELKRVIKMPILIAITEICRRVVSIPANYS